MRLLKKLLTASTACGILFPGYLLRQSFPRGKKTAQLPDPLSIRHSADAAFSAAKHLKKNQLYEAFYRCFAKTFD
ncbi:hypothetical protein [Paracidobacterium acidisoli]|uniref:hypothetical protein n=1 Tax=Paracidobacterium acidisoli TaxID=2303751 RepID=UPI0011C0F013|nr:hypothetical protein [Paracidobacterium acidisoli]MBT9329898.1 hypothetical protein [Paracidobacterium acidisoli]